MAPRGVLEGVVSEKELAARAAKGDKEAAERLVRALYPSLYRMMRAIAPSAADAEDLTQRAVLATLGKLGSYRGDASLRTWAGRVALTEFGRWNRRRRFTTWLSPELPDRSSPLEEVEAVETLRPALLSLPFPMREAFLLASLGDLPMEDIAVLQGVPLGTVKSRIHAARTKLRQRLQPVTEEQPYVEPA